MEQRSRLERFKHLAGEAYMSNNVAQHVVKGLTAMGQVKDIIEQDKELLQELLYAILSEAID